MNMLQMSQPLLTSEQLEDQFRQTMGLPVTREGERRLRGALHALTGELLSRPDLKHDHKLQSMLLACRLRLRKLQNLLASTREEDAFALRRCELRSLAEDLCAAADLLLSPLGRGVRFEAPEVCIDAVCAPQEFSWLVLELICNAARHTPGEEITLRLELKSPPRQRRPRACVLTVESAGDIDLARLHASASQPGTGASAMLRTAWLHHGALLWLARDGKSIAALRLPLQGVQQPGFRAQGDPLRLVPAWDAPDFVDLLSDQCSQVYVGLAQAIGVQSKNIS